MAEFSLEKYLKNFKKITKTSQTRFQLLLGTVRRERSENLDYWHTTGTSTCCSLKSPISTQTGSSSSALIKMTCVQLLPLLCTKKLLYLFCLPIFFCASSAEFLLSSVFLLWPISYYYTLASIDSKQPISVQFSISIHTV